jgi:hypothetical protein
MFSKEGHQTSGGLKFLNEETTASGIAKDAAHNPITGSRLAQMREAEAPENWECPGASAWQQLVAVCLSQWEKTKPIGHCQCHANCDGEGQGQNYGYVHGNPPPQLS